MLPSIRQPVADEPTNESPADACRRYIREFRRSRRAARPALVMPPICGGAPDDESVESPSGFSDTSHAAAKEGFGLLFRYAYGDLRSMIERGVKVLRSRGFTECRAREIVGVRLQDIYTAQAKRLEAKTRDFDWWTDRTEELYEQAFNSDRPSFSRFIQDYTGTRTLLLDVERGASTRIQDEQHKFNETARRNQAGSHDPERVRSLIARLRCQATDPTDPPSGFSDTDAEPFRLNADPIKPEPAGKASDRAYRAILANRHPTPDENEKCGRLFERISHAAYLIGHTQSCTRKTRLEADLDARLALYESRIEALEEWTEATDPVIREWDRIARFAAEPTPFPGFPTKSKRPATKSTPTFGGTIPGAASTTETKTKIRWRRATIAVNTNPVTFGLPALVYDGLGIVTAKAAMACGLPVYSITHLGSGNSFGVYFNTLRDAKSAGEKIVEHYPELVNEATDRTGAYSVETQAEMRRFIRSLPRSCKSESSKPAPEPTPEPEPTDPEPTPLPDFRKGTPNRQARAEQLRAERRASMLDPNSAYNRRLFDQFLRKQTAETNRKRAETRAVVQERADELGVSYARAKAGFYIKPSVIAERRRAERERQPKPAATVTIEPGQSGNGADGWLILVTTPDGRTPIREWDATRAGADAYANFARAMIEQGRTPRAIEYGSTWDAPDRPTAASATMDHDPHHGPTRAVPEPSPCCPADEPVPCMGCQAELTPLPGFSGRPVADHAALALTIDGTDYGLIVSADRQAFTIERRDGKAYEVTNGSRGLTCTCADFIHRRAGLDPSGCKHCRAIRTAGLISAVDEMPARLPSDDVRPPSGVFGRMTVKPTLADRIADTLNPDLPWTIRSDDIETIIMSLARDPKAWGQFSDAVDDLAYKIECGEIPAEPVSVPGCFAGD